MRLGALAKMRSRIDSLTLLFAVTIFVSDYSAVWYPGCRHLPILPYYLPPFLARPELSELPGADANEFLGTEAGGLSNSACSH